MSEGLPHYEAPTVWIIGVNGPVEFEFNGETIRVQEGGFISRGFIDPCEALRFEDVIARAKSPDERGADDSTNGDLDYACPEGNLPSPESLPADLQDSELPSQTGEDSTLPEEETPESMGSPSPTTSISIESEPRVPGEPGENLAREYFDAQDPLPDYDIDQALLDRRTPLDEIPQLHQRIMRNEARPGRPHHDFGRPDRDDPHTVADPVDIFKGQYILTNTDISIPSRGLPLELTRVYRSGPVYFGPWGYNWDHNYNIFLRKLDDGGVAVWTGRLTEHVYKLNPDGTFEPPPGIFLHLEHQSADPFAGERYVIEDKEGIKMILSYPEGWPDAEKIPLTRIEDRHGNAHTLHYDPEGRLSRVEDHTGRYLRFIYGNRELIEQITDHTGRIWRYFYDPELEHLIQVTTPVTAEYPNGLSTYYEYDRYRTHPALRNNLIKIIDPAGRVVVENRYGDEPNTDDFGRVVYQIFGEFEATFNAKRLQYVPSIPEAINIPALRVEVVDPGIYFVYTFNYRGDLLDERFRLVSDGSYRIVGRTYRYDKQGNVIAQREPNGMQMLFEYDYESEDPRARGNPLRIVLRAPLIHPAPAREIEQFTYEPRYNRIKTQTDENGKITTYVYDYEETTVDHGNIIRIEHPTVTLPDGSSQESYETFAYNAFGQIIERRSGENHLYTYDYYENGQAVGYLERTIAGVDTEDQSQIFGYDLYGNLYSVTDALGASTEYERNALGQLIRLRKPEINGLSGEVVYRYGPDGRLKSEELPRGSYHDEIITDLFILNEYEYDVLGHIQSAVYGANTAQPGRWEFKRNGEGFPIEIIDPLKRVIRLQYDERNLVLKQTMFVGTPEERSIRFVYDRNGNQVRIIDPAGRESANHYDSWNRLREAIFPGLEGERTHFRYIYSDGDQIERIEIEGVPAPGQPRVLLSEISHQFDERGRMIHRTQGTVSKVFWYDRDSRPVRVFDQRGNSTTFDFDALGKTRSVIDSIGNQTTYTYDKRGNLSSVDELEIVPGVPMPESYHISFHYNARCLIERLIDSLGNATQVEYDDRDLLVAATLPLEIRHEYEYDLKGLLILARSFIDSPPRPVEHRWQRDLGGRVTVYVDPENKQTQYDYNLEDRWKKIILPDGSTRKRFFDSAGQLEREVAPSGITTEFSYSPGGLVERLHFVGISGVLEVPDLVYRHDGLGRPVQMIQGGVTAGFQYDQLGRLIEETMEGGSARWEYDDVNGMSDLFYPDGRVDRYHLDALGRISHITLHQLATAPLTGETLGPETPLASYEYIGPQRIFRRVLGNGCETNYAYDQGRRLTGIEHLCPDGSPLALVQYVYDAANRRRVIRAEPSPGMSALLEYDELSRLRTVIEGVAAPAPPTNATQEESDAYVFGLEDAEAHRTYEYSLGRVDTRHQKILTDETGVTTETYGLNDLHQVTELTRSTAGPTSTHAFTYDRDGRRTGDDRYTYTYDVLGRLTEVRKVRTGSLLVRQSYDPLGRVVSRTWSGGQIECLRYIGDRLLQHETDLGIPVRQYCFGMNLDELVAQSHGEEQWCHQDARLSLIALSDSAGNPVERYSYTPFGLPAIWAADGATLRASSIFAMPPIFGGHRAIALNGLYDARARVYDAATGNFLQRDPCGYISGANLYAYIGHNPVDSTDPTGKFAVPAALAVLVIGGAVVAFGLTFYDAHEHPERYPSDRPSLRAFGNVIGGAVAGAASWAVGQVVLGLAGLGAGAGVGGTSLTLLPSAVAHGTTGLASGLMMRLGFNDMFPDYVDPPSTETMTTDFVFGGVSGVAARVGQVGVRSIVNEAYRRSDQALRYLAPRQFVSRSIVNNAESIALRMSNRFAGSHAPAITARISQGFSMYRQYSALIRWGGRVASAAPIAKAFLLGDMPTAMQNEMVDITREEVGPSAAFMLEQGFYLRNMYVDPLEDYTNPFQSWVEEHGLNGIERLFESVPEHVGGFGRK